jgi:hypothetical protein
MKADFCRIKAIVAWNFFETLCKDALEFWKASLQKVLELLLETKATCVVCCVMCGVCGVLCVVCGVCGVCGVWCVMWVVSGVWCVWCVWCEWCVWCAWCVVWCVVCVVCVVCCVWCVVSGVCSARLTRHRLLLKSELSSTRANARPNIRVRVLESDAE